MNRTNARFLTLLLLAARRPAGGGAHIDPGLWGDADFFRGGVLETAKNGSGPYLFHFFIIRPQSFCGKGPGPRP